MTGSKWTKLPCLIHPDECDKVGSLALVFRFVQAFLKPLNTFMGLDDQGNRAGRGEIRLLDHFGDKEVKYYPRSTQEREADEDGAVVGCNEEESWIPGGEGR